MPKQTKQTKAQSKSKKSTAEDKDLRAELDELRQYIGLRAYGGQKPLQAFQLEAFNLWVEFKRNVQTNMLTAVFKSLTSKAG